MRNQEVDDLIDSLTNMRLRREDIIRTLGDLNTRETELHEDLAAARIAAAATVVEPDIDANPYSIGDRLTITNNLRNEFGTTGVVIRSGVRLVTIRSFTNRMSYTRAWWNLAPIAVEEPTRRS